MAEYVMSVRPPQELRRILKEEARRRGLTLNALVITILWEIFDENYRNRSEESRVYIPADDDLKGDR